MQVITEFGSKIASLKNTRITCYICMINFTFSSQRVNFTYGYGSNDRANTNIHHYICLSIAWFKIQNKYQHHCHCWSYVQKKSCTERRGKYSETLSYPFQNYTYKSIHSPGCIASSHISSTELMLCSPGAWSTMIVEPTIHKPQPNIPNFRSFSLSKKWAKIALPIK